MLVSFLITCMLAMRRFATTLEKEVRCETGFKTGQDKLMKDCMWLIPIMQIVIHSDFHRNTRKMHSQALISITREFLFIWHVSGVFSITISIYFGLTLWLGSLLLSSDKPFSHCTQKDSIEEAAPNYYDTYFLFP